MCINRKKAFICMVTVTFYTGAFIFIKKTALYESGEIVLKAFSTFENFSQTKIVIRAIKTILKNTKRKFDSVQICD